MKKDHPKKNKQNKKSKESHLKTNLQYIAESCESIYEWPTNKREISIKSFGQFMITTIEALLLHQRKLTIQVNQWHVFPHIILFKGELAFS